MKKETYVVTIQRQFGSMGRPIARSMSEKLGIEFYDRDLVDQAAQKLNLPVSRVQENEETGEKKVILFNLSGHGLIDMTAYDQFINGDLRNYELTDQDLAKSMANLPHLV